MTGEASDLALFREVAEEAADRAGRAIAERLGTADVRFKGLRDLVTESDLLSERIVTERLRSAFPDHRVLAEEEFSRAEETAAGGDAVTADPAARPAAVSHDLSPIERALASTRYCWLVDPIDGTTNYAHRHPFFAVSIALYEHGEPAVAVIEAPALRERFVAVRGRGATLNGQPMRVTDVATLSDAIFATGFPYRRHEMPDTENNIAHLDRFLRDVRGFRRGGSAALDLAYVASGRFSFFFEAQLEPWDVAAGALLVREAGGRVTDYDGGEGWLAGRRILASNGAIHDLCLSRLRAPRVERD